MIAHYLYDSVYLILVCIPIWYLYALEPNEMKLKDQKVWNQSIFIFNMRFTQGKMRKYNNILLLYFGGLPTLLSLFQNFSVRNNFQSLESLVLWEKFL